MYRLPATTYLDEALICKFIKANLLAAERHNRLRAYYEGRHDILNRWYADPSKPNNKVVNPFPKYITDSYVGYFMGTPCQYNADDEDVAAAIADITEYNDDAAENSTLAKIASVNGVAVELLYIDSDKQIRYKASEGEHVLIYDDTIDAELLWAIRYYAVDQVADNTTEWRVDVYGMTDVRHYKSTNPSAYLELVSVEPHYFGLVPVAVYRNNAEEQGDYEQVLPLVDAYDAVESDAVNNSDYFSDAYLVLTNAVMDADDVQQMKTNRVICLPEQSSASFLIKDGNDVTEENLKNRLKADIHKFSGVPDMSDEAFGNNASGVSLKYKLITLENITGTKERYFKLGLQRRFELIANISSVMGAGFDWRTVSIMFKRTLPVDEAALVDTVNKLGDLVSDATKIDMLPYDIDVEQELAKRREETLENSAIYFGDNNQFYDNRDGLAE